ncbi:MAG: hypothetical protein WEC15_00170 [Flavobacteriales bacterium]
MAVTWTYTLIGLALWLLTPSIDLNGQSPCDARQVKKMERHYNKGRQRKDVCRGCELAYEISQCYRGVNDSLHRVWVIEAIEQRKKYSHCKNWGDKTHQLSMIGLWYTEISDLEQAETWLSKWVKVSPNMPEPYYHHGRALLSLRRGEEALSVLRTAEQKHCTQPDLDSLLSEATKASAIGGQRNQRLDSLNLTGDTWHFRSNERLRGVLFNYGGYDYFVPNPNGAPIRTGGDLQRFFTRNNDAAIQIKYSQGDEYLNVYLCADTIPLNIGTTERAEPYQRVVVADVVINTSYTAPVVPALLRREPFLRENSYISENGAITFWYFMPDQFVTSIVCSRQ